MDKEKEFLNLQEAGELVGLSRQTIRKLTHIKDFPCTKMQRRILINKDKLLKWFEENKYLNY